MTMIIRKSFILVLVLMSIISCNNDEKGDKSSATISAKEKTLREAIQKYPDSIPLRDSLIFYLESLDNIDLAIAETNKAIEIDSTNIDLFDTKARLYLVGKKDTANAILAFEKAVQILPVPELLMSLGTLYAQTKNAKALAVTDMLVKADNGKAAKEGIFLSGLYYSALGDKSKAISVFDRCLAMDYGFMPGYLEKAIALYDQSKYEDAIKVLEKAVTLQNRFDEGHYWLGRCLEKMNRIPEALEEYRTALMYDPEYAEAREALNKLEGK